MDSRLKKILDESAVSKRATAKKLAEIKEEEDKKKARQLKKDKAAAKVWIEKHIFNLIKKAEIAHHDYVSFSDHNYPELSQEGIPAYLLAEAAGKIEGLRIEQRWVQGFNDYEGPSYPDHYEYQVWWKPKLDYNYR